MSNLFSCCGCGDREDDEQSQDLKIKKGNKVGSMAVIAVVLSGAGALDGSDPFEVAAVCAAAARRGASVRFYAPDRKQREEVNHFTFESSRDTDRGILIESARLAKGGVEDIANLSADSDVSTVIVPGGFGAAKNLSTFALDSDPSVDEDVSRVLREFKETGKPLGFTSIAAVLAPMVFSGPGGSPVKITLGKTGDDWPYGAVISKVSELGADVEEREAGEVAVDEDNRIISVPLGLDKSADFAVVADGAERLVNRVLEFL